MSEIMGKKYEMIYNPDRNTFLLKVLASFTNEDAIAFFSDYDSQSKRFEATSTSLVVDCSSLEIIEPEFNPILVNLIKLFMELHYKYRIFLKSQSPDCDDIIKSAMNEGGMVYGVDGLFLDNMEAVDHLITM